MGAKAFQTYVALIALGACVVQGIPAPAPVPDSATIKTLLAGSVTATDTKGVVYFTSPAFKADKLPHINLGVGVQSLDNLNALQSIGGLAEKAAKDGKWGDVVYLYNAFLLNGYNDSIALTSEAIQDGLTEAVNGDSALIDLYRGTSSSTDLANAFENLAKQPTRKVKRWDAITCDNANQANAGHCNTLLAAIQGDSSPKSGGPRNMCYSSCCISWSRDAYFQTQHLYNAAREAMNRCSLNNLVSSKVFGVTLGSTPGINQCLSNRASHCSYSQGLDPYSHTASRWLHQDELQRQSRRLRFDFSRLCEGAVKSCSGGGGAGGASRVVDCEKKEGGYYRIFILTMDSGKRVVARVPMPVAGPAILTTNSEIATVAYLQSETSLPIPKILAWSDYPSNPIGIEYIIQEHVDGVQLHEQWPHMDSVPHILCTKGLSHKIKEMAALDFPAYGNIYFSDAPIAEDPKIPLKHGFCIGPFCSPLFWNCGAGEPELYKPPNPNRGPWRNLTDYASGLIDTAFSRLLNKEPIASDLLESLAKDSRIQAAATPALIHPDYHKRNIYVSRDDPTVITSIVDWQLACVEPAFIYVNNPPNFASLPDENPAEGKEGSNPPPQSDHEKKATKGPLYLQPNLRSYHNPPSP
ncbi:hypothetical protein AJ80_05760 [Polytolypa hystricis UAMH7299]|uniref:Altered inheritance of mitochondria protein 9, mitochondrial n=1 Tax=Polytolypa hystricis (strain UAMH7299) TaxID=1447883 RepID=A0A2B7XSS9_POLH7|nr:hypothetical protein AJ80_05760 [Polytolypa hystricis UAMH7299]